MSLRALLYRRPSEPSTVHVIFDKAIYLVRLRRHRQARRYTLRIDASSRDVVLTIPPRGSIREAKEFAQKHGGWIAARLKRLPEAAPFAHGCDVPLRGLSHRIVHRRNQRGTVWTETSSAGEPLLCVAGEAVHLNRRVNDFLKREASRDIEAASRRYASELGLTIKCISVRDQSNSLGLLLEHRRFVLLLATHSGPFLCAGLSRGTRGVSPRRAQSLPALLAIGQASLPAL